MSINSKRYGIIILVIISFLIYLNTLTHGFVYDDSYFSNRPDLYSFSAIPKAFTESYIPNNPTAGFYRPLAISSFAATYTIFGNTPFVFHVTNILLHAIATLLVFVIARTLKFSYSVSWLAALLFAVHPIHVDAVASIKSRDEIFYAISLMISWWCFIKAATAKKFFAAYAVIAAFFYLLGLFSKEMAVTIPLVCLLSLLIVRMPKKKIVIFLIGWGIATGIYAVLRYAVLGNFFLGTYGAIFPANELYLTSWTTRLLTALQIYSLYLKALVIPIHLSATYGYAHILPVTSFSSGVWIFGTIAVVITIVLGLFSIKKSNKLLMLLVGAWIMLYLPASQLLGVKGDVAVERWMYVPSIVFVLLCSWGISTIIRNKKYYIVIILITSILLSVRTYVRNPVWASNLSIYESMVKSAPKSVHAQTALAQEYFYQGKLEAAKQHAQIAVEIYPEYAELQLVLGKIATRQRKFEEALGYYQKSLELEPRNVLVYDNIARLYFVKGDYEKAYENFDRVMKTKRAHTVDDLVVYATILAKSKRHRESLAVLGQLKEAQRKEPDVQFLMAVNFYKMGETEKVISNIVWDQTVTKEEREKMLEEF